MAKVKPSKFQQLEERFRPVFTYESEISKFRGKSGFTGDLSDLLSFWVKESKKAGVEDSDIKQATSALRSQYLDGERNAFFVPGLKNLDDARASYQTYLRENLDGIIDSTDESILKSAVLPQVIGKYKVESEKYRALDELIQEVSKLNRKYEALGNSDTQEAVVKELVGERQKVLKSKYFGKNKWLADLLVTLISPQEEMKEFESKVKLKNKELDTALKSDVKGYIKSLGVEAKDLEGIYAGIFSKAYEEAAKKGK